MSLGLQNRQGELWVGKCDTKVQHEDNNVATGPQLAALLPACALRQTQARVRPESWQWLRPCHRLSQRYGNRARVCHVLEHPIHPDSRGERRESLWRMHKGLPLLQCPGQMVVTTHERVPSAQAPGSLSRLTQTAKPNDVSFQGPGPRHNTPRCTAPPPG